jgi:hypothetical protein
MYDVPPRRWVKVSRMHFKGIAARWIEAINHPDRIPWPEFCKLLHDRFGRDQHDQLSRQMFHIHQTTTVLDYVERFSTLFDQLKAYQAQPDLHYYTNRSVDGLRHDIRMVVALQRPSDLDTAYTLALLQEEMADSSKKGEFHAYDRGASFRTTRAAGQFQRPLPAATHVGDKPVVRPGAPVSEDKLNTLRSYQRARGLCDVCAEKWVRGHKCAPTIPLQAMQEVWDLFQLEAMSEGSDVEQDSPGDSSEQIFLALSSDAMRGSRGRQTI